VDLMQRVSTGIEIAGGVLRLNPRLPDALSRLDMRIRYRGQTLDLHLTRDSLDVRGRDPDAAPVKLAFGKDEYSFTGGSTHTFQLPHR
jgi:trehalose/maltose hydrolase-like predicted phosphorylase